MERCESRVLLAFSAYVNFQPSTSAGYTGYVADTGATYATRNGLTYGWNADNSANTRNRNATNSPDERYDTFNHLQNGGTFSWEIAVPNGTYSVRIVAGDAGYYNSVYKINAEGTLIVNGTPTSSSRWVTGTGTVTVSDGRLSVTNATGSSNNKINFIDIVEQTATSTVSAPAAPSGLAATASSSSQINLSWSDNSSNESGFYLDRSTSSSFTSVTTATLGANVTSFQSTGLSANTTYYYRVRAYNSGGASANSSSAYATTQNVANGPTDNPIQTKYGSTSYTWTNDIKWSSVFNAVDYGANGSDTADDTAAFNAARDAAANAGGGVVYFPAGTYTFNDHIYLKNGVVIRGANVTGNAKTAGYDPGTNFAFPPYVFSKTANSGAGTSNTTAFKKIWTTNPDTDSNIGIVNVDINRAGIEIKGSNKTPAEGGTGTNKNIVVFGVRQNNVATPDPNMPKTTYTSGTTVRSFQNAWQRWPYRFASMIDVKAAGGNVLVANNRLNDAPTDDFEQIGYVIREKGGTTFYTLNSTGQATFRYSDIGNNIDVNWVSGDSTTWYSTRATEPGSYRTGIAIRDNWSYGTKTTHVHASGDGLVIKGNVRTDQESKKVWIYPTGDQTATGPDFDRNRGWDVGGENVIIEDNDIEIYNHYWWKPQTNAYSGYFTTDGESTWDQQGTVVNGYTVRNNILRGRTQIQAYRTGDMNNILITGNTVYAKLPPGGNKSLWLWADVGSNQNRISNATISNNYFAGPVTFRAAGGGSGNVISGNTAGTSGTALEVSTSLQNGTSVSNNSGFTLTYI